MNRLLELPELLLVFTVGLIVWGVRALRRYSPASSALQRNGEPARQQLTHTERMRARFIAACVVFVLISIPHILQLVPPNSIYGLRTPTTLSDRAIWYPANAFMGWALSSAAVVSGIILFCLPTTDRRWPFWLAFVAPISAAIVAALVYVNQIT